MMPVDVTAYSRLRLTDPHGERRSSCKEEGHVTAYAHTAFSRSHEGLADASVIFDDPDGARFIGGRCYAVTDATVTASVLSMSYPGYNRWREILCLSQHGVPPETVWGEIGDWRDRPFVDLIHFADDEGCIGPVSAARLLSDFQTPDARDRFADACPKDVHLRADYLQVWDGWVTGLQLAADGGLVKFS